MQGGLRRRGDGLTEVATLPEEVEQVGLSGVFAVEVGCVCQQRVVDTLQSLSADIVSHQQ
jgi:hypothetical protein